MIVRPREQNFPISGPDNRVDRLRMVVECLEQSSCPRIPDLDHSIAARGGQPGSIRRERYIIHVTSVPGRLQARDGPLRACEPDRLLRAPPRLLDANEPAQLDAPSGLAPGRP